MRLETAIFTSIKSPRLNGYQLAATSSGVTSELAKELTMWGPAHDSLWDTRRDARSVNFHPLATGDYCLSCTTLAGAEYSGRGGGRVDTQMFVLPREVLARFACDPFLVLRALAASGRLVVYNQVPEKLTSVPLLGRSDRPDASLVSQVLDEIGPKVFDDLVEAVSNAVRHGSPDPAAVGHESPDPAATVAVLTSGHVERLFQALLHSFPPDDRLSLSFTTGLKTSPRRPFKLFVLPNDPTLIRQSQRLNGAKVIDLAGDLAACPK